MSNSSLENILSTLSKVNLCSAEAQKGSSVLTKAEDNYHRFSSEVCFLTLPITTNSKYVKHIVLLYLFCDVFFCNANSKKQNFVLKLLQKAHRWIENSVCVAVCRRFSTRTVLTESASKHKRQHRHELEFPHLWWSLDSSGVSGVDDDTRAAAFALEQDESAAEFQTRSPGQ